MSEESGKSGKIPKDGDSTKTESSYRELDYTLEDKPEDLDARDWDRINCQACGFIRMCLDKDQKYFVMRETNAKVLWKKLEDKYMTKSMENRLYLNAQ
ncbi:hypothetical protein C3L33_16202, partial [Rhododendron williamsianum]